MNERVLPMQGRFHTIGIDVPQTADVSLVAIWRTVTLSHGIEMWT